VIFVLDCSMTMAWAFADEATPHNWRMLDILRGGSAVVPTLWHHEVSNALLVGEKRKRMTSLQAGAFLDFLTELDIAVDDQSSWHTIRAAAELARHHGLTAYDAAYAELCLRRGLPLASLDDKLLAAAKKLGIKKVVPPRL
jgi:predicted nucleic acid-binding protein